MDAEKVVPLCNVFCSTERSGSIRSLPLKDCELFSSAVKHLYPPTREELSWWDDETVVGLVNSHSVACDRNAFRTWRAYSCKLALTVSSA